MYVGRFVVVGPDVAAYRVSSRSFPNRQVVERDGREGRSPSGNRTQSDDGALTVVPTEEAESTDNPYVSYNCFRTGGGHAVVGNGSHVDPIAEKLGMGYPARDALAESLLALDYEKDDYDTPRVAGVLTPDGEAFVGTVRKDALLVREVDEPTVVATYEKDSPEPIGFGAATAEEAASEAYGAAFEHRVCAAGVVRDGQGGYETAVENGEQ